MKHVNLSRMPENKTTTSCHSLTFCCFEKAEHNKFFDKQKKI